MAGNLVPLRLATLRWSKKWAMFGRFGKPWGSPFGPAESPPLNFITYIYAVYNSLQNNVSSIKFDAVSAFLSQIIVSCRASTIQINLKSRTMSLPYLLNWWIFLNLAPSLILRSFYSPCESASKWWRSLKIRHVRISIDLRLHESITRHNKWAPLLYLHLICQNINFILLSGDD